jgi:hypothetical protein
VLGFATRWQTNKATVKIVARLELKFWKNFGEYYFYMMKKGAAKEYLLLSIQSKEGTDLFLISGPDFNRALSPTRWHYQSQV